jgi:hypothetical protein
MTIQNEADAIAPLAGDDRTAELEARIAELERRLEQRGGSGGMRPDLTRAGRAQDAVATMGRNLVPDDARKHLRAATREQLLALRVYVDRWIEALGEPEEQPARRHETIEIEE